MSDSSSPQMTAASSPATDGRPSVATSVVRVKAARVIRAFDGECAYCDRNRHDNMMPPHDASSRCESGKHNHCTCDICF